MKFAWEPPKIAPGAGVRKRSRSRESGQKGRDEDAAYEPEADPNGDDAHAEALTQRRRDRRDQNATCPWPPARGSRTGAHAEAQRTQRRSYAVGDPLDAILDKRGTEVHQEPQPEIEQAKVSEKLFEGDGRQMLTDFTSTMTAPSTIRSARKPISKCRPSNSMGTAR